MMKISSNSNRNLAITKPILWGSILFATLLGNIGCKNIAQSKQNSEKSLNNVPTFSPTVTLTPAPISTPVPFGVTRKAYNMLVDGMTKSQCDNIIGFTGEIYKTYQYPVGSPLGSGGNFVKWRKGDSEISVQFDNGSLTMKFNENLK